jgi:signal transduction histidine kinase
MARVTRPVVKPSKYLLGAVAGLLVALLAAGFWLFISQSRQHDRTLMEFEALQAAAAISEYSARYGALDEAQLPEHVLGYALYDASGRARLRAGSVPSDLRSLGGSGGAPGRLPRRGTLWRLDRGSGTLRLLRRVGMPMGGGPAHGGPRGMTGGGTSRGRGMMRQPEESPPPALAGAEYLLLDYDVSHLLAGTRTRLLYLSAIGIALFALLGSVALLSRRVQRYEVDRRRQEHLVQLGEAARTLAHEIKNPLGAIKLQTAMLRKQAEAPGQLSPRLDILDEEVTRIDALVNEVREFLQSPRGTPESIDIVELSESLPARYAFPIELDLHCERPCPVRFDRNRLHSVLSNVLRNAAESTAEPDPAVTLRVERTRDSVRLIVRDHGPGLPEGSDGDRLFEPFASGKERGFGIGLAISRRFVEAAGGSITLRNRSDGPGAECVITIPAEESDARTRR